jgi:hypothetical protein
MMSDKATGSILNATWIYVSRSTIDKSLVLILSPIHLFLPSSSRCQPTPSTYIHSLNIPIANSQIGFSSTLFNPPFRIFLRQPPQFGRIIIPPRINSSSRSRYTFRYKSLSLTLIRLSRRRRRLSSLFNRSFIGNSK